MIIFYEIFIYPLELLMKLILAESLSLTGSPLFSLILLSFIITIISLPIYHIAETWQDKEREIQKKLKPKIIEFKSIFKGSSLNTYINTLYRQNSYHPVQAIRTSFGLLVQIPFFFAAYHFLSNYTEFNGLETTLFDDLGKPDGLISFGNVSLNLFPFVMFAVNIVSAFIYSKKTGKKEKWQLYGISALFLAVLYNSTSALLFYWTFNNIFSLAKNFIYTLIYKDGIIKETKTSKRQRPLIQKIYSFKPGIWETFILILIACVCFFSGTYIEKSDDSYELYALILTFVSVFPLGFFIIISNLKKRSGKSGILLSAIYGLSLVCALTLFMIGIIETDSDYQLLAFSTYLISAVILIEIIIRTIKFIDTNVIELLPSAEKKTNRLFSISLLMFSILVFITAPLTVLSSGSASDFDESFFYFASYLILFAAIFYTIFRIAYSSLSSKWQTLLTIVISCLSLSGLLNTFIFSGNYGDMSHFIFKDEIMNSTSQIIINIVSIIAVIFISTLLVIKKRTGLIISITGIALLSLISLSTVDSLSFSKKRESPENTEKKEDSEILFKFSKTGKNVVVLMLDRFIGGYVPQALRFLPELKKEFDGFVWYPNTLSPASYTIGGVPAIMGGWDYYVKNVNSTRKDVPLIKKLDESARIMPYNFDKAGYKVDIYADIKRWFKFKDKTNIGKTQFHNIDLKKIKTRWQGNNKIKSEKEDNVLRKQLLVFGIFRAAPVFLRNWIYDAGLWHMGGKDSEYNPDSNNFVSFNQKSQWRRHTCLKYYAVLDFLTELSKTDNDPDNRFIYLSNNLPHEPHTINMNFEYEPTGKVSYPKNIYNKFNKSINALKHLYTDTATLRLVRDWLDWMKKNGIYDNTRIILVSDHGRDVYNPFYDKQKIPKTRKKAHPAYFNNLLMFKDFKSHGELKTEKDFMSSLDVPYLAMKDIIEGTNPFTGNKIEIQENKLPFMVYDTQWRNEKQGKYEYKYHEKYEVSKDISKISNWKIIKEKK